MEPYNNTNNLDDAEGEARLLKSVHTARFHLYTILENTDYSEKEQVSGCLCKGRGTGRRDRWMLGNSWG